MESNLSSGEKQWKKRKVETCSSDSPEKRILYLCFVTIKKEGRIHNWFGIDLDLTGGDDQVNKFEEKPLFSMPIGYPTSFSSVALGSKIYSFGGRELFEDTPHDLPLSRVSVFDTNALLPDSKEQPEWKELPGLQERKVMPGLAPLDDRIYVIGSIPSLTHFPSHPWCELFNPKTGECQPVDGFPMAILRGFNSQVCCAVLKEREIIVVNIEGRGTYHFHYNKRPEDQWQYMPHTFGEITNCLRSSYMVAVDDIIFFYRPGGLYAYNPFHDDCEGCPYSENVGMQECSVHAVSLVEGLGQFLETMNHYVYLFNSGGKDLCLVWQHPAARRRGGLIYCIRFAIDRTHDNQFRASVHTQSMYNVPEQASLEHCVQVVHN